MWNVVWFGVVHTEQAFHVLVRQGGSPMGQLDVMGDRRVRDSFPMSQEGGLPEPVRAACTCKRFGSRINILCEVGTLSSIAEINRYLHAHGVIGGGKEIFLPAARSLADQVCRSKDSRQHQGVANLTMFSAGDFGSPRTTSYGDLCLLASGKGLKTLPSIIGVRSAVGLCRCGDMPFPEQGIVIGMNPVECVGFPLLLHVFRRNGIFSIESVSADSVLNSGNPCFVFASEVC